MGLLQRKFTAVQWTLQAYDKDRCVCVCVAFLWLTVPVAAGLLCSMHQSWQCSCWVKTWHGSCCTLVLNGRIGPADATDSLFGYQAGGQ